MDKEKLVRFYNTNVIYFFHAFLTVISARLFDLEQYYTPVGMFVYFAVVYLVVGYLLMFKGFDGRKNNKK